MTAAATAVVALLAAGGCAGGSGDTAAPAARGSTSSSTQAADPTRTGPALPSGKPSVQVVTVSGRVTGGVEAGCLVLKAGSGGYLLLGRRSAELRPGARVTVTGRLDDSVVSTCQQARPLLVSKVWRR